MKNTFKRNYLTLIELLISLGILAAVASVTLSMLEESTSQQRFKRTYDTGDKIRKVINAENTDDKISRFISDMGRLPIVINTADGMRLAELYDISSIASNVKWNSSNAFSNSDSSLPSEDGILSFPDDFTVLKLSCGWAGPYLYNHKEQLLDGWNNEWHILDSNFDIIASAPLGTFFYGVESFGSNDSVDEDSWSSKRQKFKFNITGQTAANHASLVVTFMVKDNKVRPPVMQPVVNSTTTSASAWAANYEYQINDEVKNSDFVFRCISNAIYKKRKSGTVEPTWNTSAVGAQTFDRNIVWEYNGVASDQADWRANCVYQKNDTIKAGGNAYTCIRVRPISGSSTPLFQTKYGDTTSDGDFTWQCVYPEPTVMNNLRIAVFSPRISRNEKGVRRFMAIRNGSSLTEDHANSISFTDNSFFSAMPDETASWTAHNQVELKNLTPGNRKIYAYGFYKNGSNYRNKLGSGVLDIKLLPGVNSLTVYLTNEL